MARQRKTTSVSTLVNDITTLVIEAKDNEDESRLKEIAPVFKEIHQLHKDYNRLRKAVDAFMTEAGSTEVFDIHAYVDGLIED